MRAMEVTTIRGTDEVYVPEIESFSFVEDVVQWRPGERVVFRPFRFPISIAALVAGGAALLAGFIAFSVRGDGWTSFALGAAVVGMLVTRWIRGPARAFVFDWETRTFEIRRGWRVRVIQFDQLHSIDVRWVNDPLVAKGGIGKYKSILSVVLSEERIDLLHATQSDEDPCRACERLTPAARWLSVSLSLSMRVASPAEESWPASEHVSGGHLELIRAKYAQSSGKEDPLPFVRAAIANFAAASRADPNGIAGLLEIAKLCEEMEDRRSANEVYAKVLEIAPDNIDALVRRGFNHQLAKEFEDAIADFTEALLREPKVEDHHRRRGSVNYEAGHYSEAIEDFTRFLELTEVKSPSKSLDSLRESRRATILAERALAHWKMGALDLAQRDANRALRLEKDNPLAIEARTILRHAT